MLTRSIFFDPDPPSKAGGGGDPPPAPDPKKTGDPPSNDPPAGGADDGSQDGDDSSKLAKFMNAETGELDSEKTKGALLGMMKGFGLKPDQREKFVQSLISGGDVDAAVKAAKSDASTTAEATQTGVWDQVASDVVENEGKLSSSMRQVLRDKGLVDSDIDKLVEMSIQQHNDVVDEIDKRILDGHLDEIRTWANEKFDGATVELINQTLRAKSAAYRDIMLAGLKATWESRDESQQPAATVTEPRGPAPSGDGFSSPEELTAAINDPRYETDTTYTAQVDRKIANSESLDKRLRAGA